jgi:hypothetical protein
MNEIEKSIYKAHFPKLKIEIGRFKNKKTDKISWCVMSVSTPLTESTHHYNNASEWEKLDSEELEGVERIQECYDEDLIKQMERK